MEKIQSDMKSTYSLYLSPSVVQPTLRPRIFMFLILKELSMVWSKNRRRELHRYDRENIRNFQVSSSFDDYAVVYSAETSCMRRCCCVSTTNIEKISHNSSQKALRFHVKKVGKVLKVLKCSYCRTSTRATLFSGVNY